jgi:hypothetical protein
MDVSTVSRFRFSSGRKFILRYIRSARAHIIFHLSFLNLNLDPNLKSISQGSGIVHSSYLIITHLPTHLTPPRHTREIYLMSQSNNYPRKSSKPSVTYRLPALLPILPFQLIPEARVEEQRQLTSLTLNLITTSQSQSPARGNQQTGAIRYINHLVPLPHFCAMWHVIMPSLLLSLATICKIPYTAYTTGMSRSYVVQSDRTGCPFV